MNRLLVLLILTAWVMAPMPVAAQDPDPAAPPPLPPPKAKTAVDEDLEDVPIPPKVDGEQVAPTVDIRRDEEGTITEEYRLEGRVYMVKVIPKKGVPYYYLDDDGDGQLELQVRDRAAYPVKPVYWKVKEW